VTQQVGGEPEAQVAPVVGIALSGGGVRSAAFGLGALQALQRRTGLVHGAGSARFLAAVSGGSYTAAAILMALGGPLSTPSRTWSGRSWELADGGKPDVDGHPTYADQTPLTPLMTRRLEAFGLRSTEWMSVKSPDPLRPGSTESDYLRVHARYLTEGAQIKTVLSFTWLIAFSVLASVSAAVLLGWVGQLVWSLLNDQDRGTAIFSGAVLLVVVGCLAILLRLRRTVVAGRTRESEMLVRDVIGILVGLAVATTVAVLYVGHVDQANDWFGASRERVLSVALLLGIGGSGSLGGVLVSLVRAQLAPRRDTSGKPSRLANAGRTALIVLVETLLLLLVPLAFVAAFVLGWLDAEVMTPYGRQPLVAVAGGVIASGLVIAAVLGDSALSPHALYRNRLARAFSMLRQQHPDQPQGIDPSTQGGESEWPVRTRARLQQPRLSALIPRPAGRGEQDPLEIPELLICASVNISEVGVAAAGSYARPIVFSPSWIYLAGEPTGRLQTEAFERTIGRPASWFRHSFDGTVMSYVALTGAAVSPTMGKFTKTWLRAALTLLNIRLGTWIPNPASDRVQALVAKGELAPRLNLCPSPLLWLRELRGRHYLASRHIYVSDGGHYENLGIVELIRRGCDEVWAFDASDDDRGTWRALSESLNLIASELGCEVKGDFGNFEADDQDSRLIRRTYADVTVSGLRDGKTWTAVIHVVKLGMSRETNPVIRQLAGKYRKFPYDSTLNQLYTAERFDLYRALGYDSATAAIDATGSFPTD
jgi:hypothetical protein